MHRAVIVLNPASRNAPTRAALEAACRAVASDTWQFDVRLTEAPGHGVQIARDAAAEGVDIVFSCGGDGTINEVVNGIARTETALGVLRGGMGDVFGREVGIPRPPAEALCALIDGDRRRFDLGLAGDRYFLVMAGIGFDAAVVRAVPSRPKRLLGSTSYVLYGAAAMARYRARDVILRIDGQELDARLYWMLLGNTRSYGGVIRITDEAEVDDGRLDAYLFEGSGIRRIVSTFGRIARHRLQDAPGVRFQRAAEVEVVSAGLPVQVDGEYAGETPMRFAVAPAALDVLLPRGHATELFGATTAASPRCG